MHACINHSLNTANYVRYKKSCGTCISLAVVCPDIKTIGGLSGFLPNSGLPRRDYIGSVQSKLTANVGPSVEKKCIPAFIINLSSWLT